MLNPSSHSLVYFCIAISNFKHVINIKCDSSLIRNCNWSKATAEHIEQYQLSLNERLLLIETYTIMTNCRDWHCQCVEHRNHINVLCRSLINYCIDASHETIPMNRRVGKDVPGWDKLVRPERDRSLFWHWMWQESGNHRTALYIVL